MNFFFSFLFFFFFFEKDFEKILHTTPNVLNFRSISKLPNSERLLSVKVIQKATIPHSDPRGSVLTVRSFIPTLRPALITIGQVHRNQKPPRQVKNSLSE